MDAVYLFLSNTSVMTETLSELPSLRERFTNARAQFFELPSCSRYSFMYSTMAFSSMTSQMPSQPSNYKKASKSVRNRSYNLKK